MTIEFQGGGEIDSTCTEDITAAALKYNLPQFTLNYSHRKYFLGFYKIEYS